MEEQLAQEDGTGGSNRSEILNRISKMGQSMLPGSTAASTSAASEDDVVRKILPPSPAINHLHFVMFS